MIVGEKDVFDKAIFEHANVCSLPTFLMNGGAFLYDFVQKFYQEEAQKTDASLIDRFLNRYTANAGEGIDNILRTLEQIIKMPVFIFDCDNNPLLSVTEWELGEEAAFEQLAKKV